MIHALRYNSKGDITGRIILANDDDITLQPNQQFVIISHHHPALHKWSYWCVENGELKEREHGPDQPDAA